MDPWPRSQAPWREHRCVRLGEEGPTGSGLQGPLASPLNQEGSCLMNEGKATLAQPRKLPTGAQPQVRLSCLGSQTGSLERLG